MISQQKWLASWKNDGDFIEWNIESFRTANLSIAFV